MNLFFTRNSEGGLSQVTQAAFVSFRRSKGLTAETAEQEWDSLDCDGKAEWVPEDLAVP